MVPTSGRDRTVCQVVADSPVVSGRDVVAEIVHLGRAPRQVLGDVAEVEGARVVRLVPESERELARKVRHSNPGRAARFAF